jgi:hypothetical protein
MKLLLFFFILGLANVAQSARAQVPGIADADLNPVKCSFSFEHSGDVTLYINKEGLNPFSAASEAVLQNGAHLRLIGWATAPNVTTIQIEMTDTDGIHEEFHFVAQMEKHSGKTGWTSLTSKTINFNCLNN